MKLGKFFIVQMECLVDFEINELLQNMELVKTVGENWRLTPEVVQTIFLI